MTIHRNSLAAYHGSDFNDREQAILDCLAASSVPLTDLEICRRLGFGDNRNKVSPRITTLIHERHVLCEAGDVVCKETGKTVRTVAIAVPVQQRLLA